MQALRVCGDCFLTMPEGPIVTLPERKAAKVAALEAAVTTLSHALTTYAKGAGGRFLLYGSAARNELRHDSDVDLLLDFHDHASTSDAWTFAEEECARLGLVCDILPIIACKQRFLDHILVDAQPLG